MTDADTEKNADKAHRASLAARIKEVWVSNPELRGNVWALVLGTVAGWGIVSGVIWVLGPKGGSAFLVIAVGVGIASFVGAVLRVIAHFKTFEASGYVDMAGKALAMMTALQLVFQTCGRL